MCGQVGCTQVPPTEFWFPDNLPSEADVDTHRRRQADSTTEVELEEPVTGDAHRPTAESYAPGGVRRRRARTGRRSRWPAEDRAIHPAEDRGRP